MSAERTQKALRLAESLIDCPEAEWLTELERAAPGDRKLHELVVGILRSSGQVLDPPDDDTLSSLVGRVLADAGPADDADLAAAIEGIPEWYEVDRLVGRGGSSVVFRARDLRSDQWVAIKLFRIADQGDLAPRARREIRIGTQLDHPGIVPVLQAGEAGRYSFLVMPYFEGGTLRDRLDASGPLPIATAVSITLGAAEALMYAHRRGVVHRDVKPENFLMRGDRPSLTDFGIAHEFEVDVNTFRTAPGQVIGTVSYMSPERAAGGKDDPRSDLYSLGCVFYEMVTGEPPFLGATAESVMSKRLTGPPNSPSRLRPTVPPSIVAILDRLLAESIADRFTDAEALVEALQSIDPAPSPGWKLGSGMSKKTVAAWVMGGTTITVLAAGAAWLGTDQRAAAFLDPNVIVVLPTVLESDWDGYDLLDQALVRELGDWDEVSVINANRVSELLRDEPAGVLTLRRSRQLAATLGAGRFVATRTQSIGTGRRYTANTYSSRQAPETVQRNGSFTYTGYVPDEGRLADLSDRLLFGDRWLDDGGVGPLGTRNMAARSAFGAGAEAAERWELDDARERLREALGEDPDFVAAHLMMARVGNWLGDPAALWGESARRALDAGALFSSVERLEAAGLAMIANEQFAAACDAYAQLAVELPRSFAATYGQGECRWQDPIVEPDRTSPSGWRFRSNQAAAIAFFERAFQQTPQSIAAFRDRSFQRLRSRLALQSSSIRISRQPGSVGTSFAGYPMLVSDTLAFVPFPLGGGLLPDPVAVEQALARQRAVVRTLTGRWLDASPDDPGAM